jgi:uncharacterized protein (TIGR03083 family)
MTSSALPPIVTAPLFEQLDDQLLALLESLPDDDWQRPTVVPRWNVRQVAAHLLDTALRRLSLDRDGGVPDDREPIANADDLKRLVNELNARGVAVYGALSTRMLITLLDLSARELRQHFLSLDPMQPASWPVSWAGEARSMNWFDTAREFTERWHHQQQIRNAVARPGIMTPRLYAPVLDTFMRALPFAYRAVPAAIGEGVRVRVNGECGGEWLVRREQEGWRLVHPSEPVRALATTTIPQDLAWQIFTRAVSPTAARPLVAIEGHEPVGATVLHMIAIVG